MVVYTPTALLIAVILILLVITVYLHFYYLNYQCSVSPNIWCNNDYYCESNPNLIGAMPCSNGDCSASINALYQGSLNSCSNGCDSKGCQCAWTDQVTTTSSPPADPPTCNSQAKSGAGLVTIGTYICGQADQTCPQNGTAGCNPNCITAEDYCC